MPFKQTGMPVIRTPRPGETIETLQVEIEGYQGGMEVFGANSESEGAEIICGLTARRRFRTHMITQSATSKGEILSGQPRDHSPSRDGWHFVGYTDVYTRAEIEAEFRRQERMAPDPWRAFADIQTNAAMFHGPDSACQLTSTLMQLRSRAEYEEDASSRLTGVLCAADEEIFVIAGKDFERVPPGANVYNWRGVRIHAAPVRETAKSLYATFDVPEGVSASAENEEDAARQAWSMGTTRFRTFAVNKGETLPREHSPSASGWHFVGPHAVYNQKQIMAELGRQRSILANPRDAFANAAQPALFETGTDRPLVIAVSELRERCIRTGDFIEISHIRGAPSKSIFIIGGETAPQTFTRLPAGSKVFRRDGAQFWPPAPKGAPGAAQTGGKPRPL